MSNLTEDHSGLPLGRQPARLDEHHARALKLSAFVDDALPPPPPVVDYLTPMSSIPMLGNDRVGNCVVAAIMHLIQSVTAVMGRERVFTEAEALRTYGILGGWPDRDEGLNMFEAVARWIADPSLFGDVVAKGMAVIDGKDWEMQQQGQWLMGGLLNGYDLPLIAQRQAVWRLEMGEGDDQIRPGGWGGHATHTARRRYNPAGRPVRDDTTWGLVKPVTSSFIDSGCGAECIVVLIDGWEPPNVPGFDGDRMLRAMKEHGR